MVLKRYRFYVCGISVVTLCTLYISNNGEPPELDQSDIQNRCIECIENHEKTNKENEYYISYLSNSSNNIIENKFENNYSKKHRENKQSNKNIVKGEFKLKISARHRQSTSSPSSLGQYRTEVIKIVSSSSINRTEWRKAREMEYKRRTDVVDHVCKKYNVKPNQGAMTHLYSKLLGGFTGKASYLEHVDPDNFYIARSASTLACVINKVASTSLVMGLLDADGLPRPTMETHSPHGMADSLKPKTDAEFKLTRKYFFKFMMVRHPFERLLSAYRDKVERANHWSLLNLRSHILATKSVLKEIKRKRQEQEIINENVWGSAENLKPNIKNDTEHNFPFLEHNFESARAAEYNRLTANKRTHINNDADKAFEVMNLTETNSILNMSSAYVNETVPSFEDFLEYILITNLEGGGFDSHWVPYWKRCSPCSVKYNVIAKLETGDQDFQYIWQRTSHGKLESAVPWQNRSGGTGSSDGKLLRKYYSTLSKDLIKRVHQRFLLDFELFQYDIRTVYQLAGHCHSDLECNHIINSV
ncbi:unnamed protein product [Meganyctiphanes norvegica]|uniref:Carbohydrate sulfotransferase n=1 Tax=Meganyctiphanes norvegica TaxID=48144 RepID=A0AAV2QWT7_MEGNR